MSLKHRQQRDCLKGRQHLIDEHLIRCCTPAFVCKGAVGRDAKAYTDIGIQVSDIGIHTSSYIYHRMYFVIDPDIPDLVLCLSVAQGKKNPDDKHAYYIYTALQRYSFNTRIVRI